MELKAALKDQFYASLEMLDECVEKCPDDLWTSGDYPRYYWRVVFHAIFFTHVGIVQEEASYVPWPEREIGVYEEMWHDPAYVEPYELPDTAPVMSRSEMRRYIAHVMSLVDASIDGLDLDTDESGYRWYEGMAKLPNLLMNLRHIQGHVGQLSELLMMREIDITWVSMKGSRG